MKSMRFLLRQFFIVSSLIFFAFTIMGFRFSKTDFPVSHSLSHAVHRATQMQPLKMHDATVGGLSGKLNVTPNGAANYSIPIDVAPGTAGMSPQLTISYNSQQENGSLGMGFALGGLTAITRTAQNKIQNGKIQGVNFTNDDRFSLDSQQLVSVNGDYGANQTEYRTYLDSQAKIISYGQQGNGPEKFKVWTKGGQIAEYGYTQDSRVEAQGKTTVAEWALNKIEDPSGNYLSVKYEEDTGNGIHYPKEIDYTGNDAANLKPYNQVRFIYEDRPDVQIHYRAGSKITLNKRLKAIEVFIDNDKTPTLLYTYKFSYEQSPSTLRSRLVSVQKCDASGICLSPTTFHWQDKKPGWSISRNQLPEPLFNIDSSFHSYARLLDLNSNGKLDEISSYQIDDAAPHQAIWMQQADGAWQQSSTYQLPHVLTRYVGDKIYRDSLVDLDGKDMLDLVHVEDYQADPLTADVWLNDGENFQKANYQLTNIPPESSASKLYDLSDGFFDLNGDGLTDFVYSHQDANYNIIEKAWINSGKGFSENDSNALPAPMLVDGSDGSIKPWGFFASVSGDGLEDYINMHYPRVDDVYLNRSTQNAESIWDKTDFRLPTEIGLYYKGANRSTGDRLIDLDGDGLSDYVFSVNDNGRNIELAWVNTGNGWELDNDYVLPKPMYYVDDQGNVSRRGYFVDVNHDGYPDYIYAYYNSETDHAEDVYLNTGSGWQKASYTLPLDATSEGYRGLSYADRFVDLNGNGLVDYVYAYTGVNGNASAIYLNNGPVPDLLDTITNGLGAQTNITYSPLTDDQVYMKEHDAQYPDVDIQTPIYVVSKTSSETDVNDGDSNAVSSHVTDYHYAGAKMNHLGLGFLGFHQITKTDESTGISETTTYDQDASDHIISKPIATEIHKKNGTLIGATENHWTAKTFGNGELNQTYYLPYNDKVIRKGYSLSGKLTATTKVDTTVDDYNNPTKVVESVTGATGTYTTTTVNVYHNDPATWNVGELTQTTVTQTAPDTPDLSRTSAFSYDATTGLLNQTIVEPDDAHYTLTKMFNRNSFGEVIDTTVSGQDIESRTSSVKYDDKGRFVVQTTNALNQIAYRKMNAGFGEPDQTIDANGLRTMYQYDGFGRLIETTYPDGTQTQAALNWYSPDSLTVRANHAAHTVLNDARYVKTIQQTDSPTQQIYYDRLGREIARTKQGFNGEWIWKTTQYDELDRPVKKSLPYFAGEMPLYTQFQYNELGQLIKTISPDGSVTAVNPDGLKTITTNALGHISVIQKNVRGKMIESTDNRGSVTKYQYDAYDHLTHVIDCKGNQSTIQYDKLGRKIAMNDPDKGNWTYHYNVLGELAQQTDAKNQTTTFQYDLLGRMIARTDLAGTSTWVYGNDPAQHSVGKLIQVNGIAGRNGQMPTSIQVMQSQLRGLLNYQQSIIYNDLSLPQETDIQLNDTHYVKKMSYDRDSRPQYETDPDGFEKENVYNDLGYLTEIRNAKTGQLYRQINAVDAAGHVTNELHSNGLITQRTYDPKTGYLTDIVTYPSLSIKMQNQLLLHQKTDSDSFNDAQQSLPKAIHLSKVQRTKESSKYKRETADAHLPTANPNYEPNIPQATQNKPFSFTTKALATRSGLAGMFFDPYSGVMGGTMQFNMDQVNKELQGSGLTAAYHKFAGDETKDTFTISGTPLKNNVIYHVNAYATNLYGRSVKPISLSIQVGSSAPQITTTDRIYRNDQSISSDQAEVASVRAVQGSFDGGDHAVVVTNADALKSKYDIDSQIDYSSDKTEATVTLKGDIDHPTFQTDQVKITAKDSNGDASVNASAKLDIQDVPSVDSSHSDLGSYAISAGDHYAKPRVLIDDFDRDFKNPTQSGAISKIRLVSDQYTQEQLQQLFGLYVDAQHNLVVQSVPTNAPQVSDLAVQVYATNDIGESKDCLTFHLSTTSGWLQSLHYDYDALGNPIAKHDLATHTQENFHYDDLNRLTDWSKTYQISGKSHASTASQIGQTRKYEYDDLGNLIYKSDMGTYFYSKTDAGPHAVTSITSDDGKTTDKFEYDANGDQTSFKFSAEIDIFQISFGRIPALTTLRRDRSLNKTYVCSSFFLVTQSGSASLKASPISC